MNKIKVLQYLHGVTNMSLYLWQGLLEAACESSEAAVLVVKMCKDLNS